MASSPPTPSDVRTDLAGSPQQVPTHGADCPTRIRSEQLFAGATELQIEHHGALYRLKKTSSGKLILTK